MLLVWSQNGVTVFWVGTRCRTTEEEIGIGNGMEILTGVHILREYSESFGIMFLRLFILFYLFNSGFRRCFIHRAGINTYFTIWPMCRRNRKFYMGLTWHHFGVSPHFDRACVAKRVVVSLSKAAFVIVPTPTTRTKIR